MIIYELDKRTQTREVIPTERSQPLERIFRKAGKTAQRNTQSRKIERERSTRH